MRLTSLAGRTEARPFFERIERAFQEALDGSLRPRGPEMLFDVVGKLGLPAGASAVDVGRGKGQYTIELARRSQFAVLGIDPVDPT